MRRNLVILFCILEFSIVLNAQNWQTKLTWNGPPNPQSDPAVAYNILRAPIGSSTFVVINSVPIKTGTYYDTTVLNSTSYQYEVESIDSNGNLSTPTSPITVVIPGAPNPGTPTNLNGNVIPLTQT